MFGWTTFRAQSLFVDRIVRLYWERKPFPSLGVPSLLAPWVVLPLTIVDFAFVDHTDAPLVMLFVLGPLGLLLSVASALRCCYLVVKRRWWPGLIVLIFPAAIFLHGSQIVHSMVDAGDVIRFVMLKPTYDARVATQNGNDTSPVLEFNWGGMNFASDGVVYDRSDEISLPKNRRSASWQNRERNTDLMCGEEDLVYGVRPLWDHYYLAGFGC